MDKAIQIKPRKKNFDKLIPVLFLLHVLLIFPRLFRTLGQINMWDEALYLEGGRAFFYGYRPPLFHYPLTYLFNALSFIPFRESPSWFLYSHYLSHLLLMGLLWTGTVLIAKHMSTFFNPLVMIVLLMGSIVVPVLTYNTSDFLFVVISQLAFWQALKFRETKHESTLAKTSFLLGLSALARNDGYVVFSLFVIWAVTLLIQTKNFRRSSLAALFTPFALIIGFYLFFCGFKTGSPAGVVEKTRHLLATAPQKMQTLRFHTPVKPFPKKLISPRADTEMKGIRPSPPLEFESNLDLVSIYVKRKLTKSLWPIWWAYGVACGFLLGLLALRGLLRLLRQRAYSLLSLFFLWPLHLVVYNFNTLRRAHLLFPFFIVLILASVGATAILGNIKKRKETYFWFFICFAGAVQGILALKIMRTTTALTCLIGLYLIQKAYLIFKESERLKAVAFAVFVGLVLLTAQFNKIYLRPAFQVPDTNPTESAAKFMRDHLPPGSAVAVRSPGFAWMAGMKPVILSSKKNRVVTSEELKIWLKNSDAQAVYLKKRYRSRPDPLYLLFEDLAGELYELAFMSANDTSKLFFLKGHLREN